VTYQIMCQIIGCNVLSCADTTLHESLVENLCRMAELLPVIWLLFVEGMNVSEQTCIRDSLKML